MINCSDLLTLVLPFIAVVISIVTTYINNQHQSMSLAIKYDTYLESLKNDEKETNFNKSIHYEAELASRFYLWKSLSCLSTYKRDRFNYAFFLVYTFGWIGMGLVAAAKTVEETGQISIVFLAGSISMLFASFLMSYSRYKADLYLLFLNSRKEDEYLHSYIAVRRAKSKVFDESILPVALSFFISLIGYACLDSEIISIVWNAIIVIGIFINNTVINKRNIKNVNDFSRLRA